MGLGTVVPVARFVSTVWAMCGRFTYLFTWGELHRLLSLSALPAGALSPRYNVAPTQEAPVVRAGEGGREGVMLRWGLVPFWAEDPSIGNRLINARGESARSKPAFRAAFARRRCVVPVSGFYEWQKMEGSTRKRPHWIGLADRGILLFAGLWERWDKGDAPLESFTILTTDANALVAPIHHRMPVVLAPSDVEAWLDPANEDLDGLEALVRPAASEGMATMAISTRVNNPRVDDPSVLAAGETDKSGEKSHKPRREPGLWEEEA